MAGCLELGSQLGLESEDDGRLAPEFEGVGGVVEAGYGWVFSGGEVDDFFSGEGFAVFLVVVVVVEWVAVCVWIWGWG